MIKAAIFDLDGTIAETLESIAYSTNKTLEEFGYGTLETERFKTIVGDGAETQIRRVLSIFGVLDEEKVKEVLKRYIEIFEEGCVHNVTPCRGIPELIAKLKERGIKTAVCSNKPYAQTLKVVHAIYPEGSFDIILGQKEGVPKKPAPDMPLSIADALNAEPEECLYLGDTNTDMKTGKNAGMFTIGVAWGFREDKELIESGADRLVYMPKEVLELIG